MNEEKLSTVLDNLLGLLLLEGSYDMEEKEEAFFVSIDTTDAGRLIGANGETLQALQSIINQIVYRVDNNSKRVMIDVEGWRKQKEEDLTKQSEIWAKEVIESKKEMELVPMSPWQRRIVHMIVSGFEELETESAGEGRERHIVIRVKGQGESVKDEVVDKDDAKSKKD